jgi:hypothetical protein
VKTIGIAPLHKDVQVTGIPDWSKQTVQLMARRLDDERRTDAFARPFALRLPSAN